MIRHAWFAGLLLAGAVAGGCSAPTPGSSREIQGVDYASAFAAGREVMQQYFHVASADPATGVIDCAPKAIEAPPERLLGRSPAREVATMRIRRAGDGVVAYVAVAVQRQGSAVYRQMRPPGVDNYNEVPDQTPAEREAATTAEQNEDWRTQSYDARVERTILQDLYNTLRPKSAGSP